jgi:hypothetical protein
MQNNNNSNLMGDAIPGTSSRSREGEEETSMNFSFLMEASMGSFPAYMAALAPPGKGQSEPLQSQGEEQDEDDQDAEDYEDEDDVAQEELPSENSTMIRVSLNPRQQASEFSQRSLLLEEGSAHTGKGDFDRDDLEDVDFNQDDDTKNDKGIDTFDKKGEDDDEDQDGDEQSSVMSDSQRDDEASTIDIAEEIEKRNRKSILMAIFTACGIIFLVSLLSRWCNRSNNEGEQGAEILAEEAAQEVAHEVGDQAGAAVMRAGLLAKQQSMANVMNPAIM